MGLDLGTRLGNMLSSVLLDGRTPFKPGKSLCQFVASEVCTCHAREITYDARNRRRCRTTGKPLYDCEVEDWECGKPATVRLYGARPAIDACNDHRDLT